MQKNAFQRYPGLITCVSDNARHSHMRVATGKKGV